MKWVGLVLLWGGLAVAATPDPLAKNVFLSRPCAGLLSTFLYTHRPLFGGERRLVSEATQCSARNTLHRMITELFKSTWAIDQNATVLADSRHTNHSTTKSVIERMGSLRNVIGERRTLVGLLDGQNNVENFVLDFHDQTTRYVETCQKPDVYREKELQGRLGQVLCGAGGVLSLAALLNGAEVFSLGAATMSLASALYFPVDFPWLLARDRDGTDRESALMPGMFENALSIARNEADAPEWLHWGTGVRFSVESLQEIWHRGASYYIPEDLKAAMELDDTIRTMPFMERVSTWWRGRQLKRKNPSAYDQLMIQAYGPEVMFDFILLKAGTLGLQHPRLIVGFRLPPYVNEDDGDGGRGRRKPRAPTPLPRPDSHPSPELVH